VQKRGKEILSNSAETVAIQRSIYKFSTYPGSWSAMNKIESLDCGKMDEAGARTSNTEGGTLS